jgi:hypothetical protein
MILATRKNTMIKNQILWILIGCVPLIANAQSVSVNATGNQPDSSAMLDVQSNTKGMLIPRMTTVQRELINNPAVGLLVFDLDTESFWFKETSSWAELRDGNINSLVDDDNDTKIQVEESSDEDVIRFDLAGQEQWLMTGGRLEPKNTGKSVFIGDGTGANDNGTDNWNVGVGDSVLAVNTSGHANVALGYQSMFSNTTGWYNTAIGHQSMFSNTSGMENAAFGYQSLQQNTSGSRNTAIGYWALNANTGSQNSAFGHHALRDNTTGKNNTACGYDALGYNTTGDYNAALGIQALYLNLTGDYNVAIGRGALFNNSDRSLLVAIGDSALYRNSMGAVFESQSIQNTAIGARALSRNTIGSSNTALGFHALHDNTSGQLNTAVGTMSLENNVNGDFNVAIGYQALQDHREGNSNTAIGLDALANDTTGVGNTAIGGYALINNRNGQHNTGVGSDVLFNNRTGNKNVAVGHRALHLNITTSNNVAVGDSALHQNDAGLATGIQATGLVAVGSKALSDNSTGYANTGVGYHALKENTTGDHNTAIGYLADVGSDNLTNATAIGANATVSQSNSLILGNDVRVGIGISAPRYELHVGDGDISALNGSNTRMVVSDNDNAQRAAMLGLARTSGGARVEAQLEANGSGTSGPSVIVGAASSHPLYIRTGNLTRMTVTTSGDVGIGTSSPSEKLHVAGNICYTGSIAACSDIRYKINLAPVSGILPMIKSIGVYTYSWDTLHFPERGFTDDLQLGVIAQELEQFFPELVQTDQDGYKAVDYAKLSAILLQGINEQQLEITTLQQRLESQDLKIDALANLVQQTLSATGGSVHPKVSVTGVLAMQ